MTTLKTFSHTIHLHISKAELADAMYFRYFLDGLARRSHLPCDEAQLDVKDGKWTYTLVVRYMEPSLEQDWYKTVHTIEAEYNRVYNLSRNDNK